MTETEFQLRVVEALEPHSEALQGVLQRLIRHDYPSEVVCIDFEVFPEGFTRGFPVRAFFMDQQNSEFFLFRNGKAEYPSAVDPGLLDLPRVYDASLEAELERANPAADSYTLAGQALIPWFARNWVEAGGLGFNRRAGIQLHDDPAAFDLVSQRWRTE